MKQFPLLSVVAITEDVPQAGLVRGQVGTIVEHIAPDWYLVEFSDDEGHTYAMPELGADQLMRLHYSPVSAAA